MRPYFAIIKDSFREALASRTLWILLVLIAVTLTALAPFSYRPVLTAGLRHRDILDWSDFIAELRKAAGQDEPSPAAHIWRLLDEPTRERLRDFQEPPRDAAAPDRLAWEQIVGGLRDELNQFMKQAAFYNADAWRRVNFQAEGRRLALADPAELSQEEIGRRNRLALEAAFPDLVRISPPNSTQFTYLGMEVFWPVPFEPEDVQEPLTPGIAFVLDWVVGPVGIFVAVLVTASIIPQMFDAGALNLLLSKPISRSLLFLFKVLGGCAFVLIAAAILFVGLWLILGVRLGIWSHELLLYIPIYMFLFIIYYVVSAFSGLVWRSTIVAIAVSVAFWAACYGVGSAEWALRSFLLEPQQITHIVPAGKMILTLNEFRVPNVWDEKSQEWQEVFLTAQQQQIRNRFPLRLPEIDALAYVPQKERLLVIQREFTGGRALWAGSGESGWRRRGGGDVPSDVIGLFVEPDGEVVAVARSGVHRLTGDPTAAPRSDALFGLGNLLPKAPLFAEVSRSLPPFPEPHAAAMAGESGRIAVYTRGRLYLLAADEEGRYRVEHEERLAIDEEEPAVLAFGRDTILIATKEGEVLEVEADSLQTRRTLKPEAASPPRFAYASPQGRYLAIVFHNGKLWLYDNQTQTLERPSFAGQGEISAAAFPSEEEILVADRAVRVSRYSLESQQVKERIAPEMDLLHVVYRYAVLPIYTIFPKPSELYKTSQYLITGQETQAIEDGGDDLSDPQTKLHPWRPVWSSLAFVVVMLILACAYFERQEF
ncbi:MAG: ABC transporter permease [Planctomycetes bacterium]|nr:ABC transporter permease [Planctomycetota bacterium]